MPGSAGAGTEITKGEKATEPSGTETVEAQDSDRGLPSDPAQAFDLRAALRRVERDLLAGALKAHRFNQRATARQLGLSYDQLRNRLRKHGLLERPA